MKKSREEMLKGLAVIIMKETKDAGEPVTFEEAMEMAKMELNEKEIKRYETAETKPKRAKRERKVDEVKYMMMDRFIVMIENFGGTVQKMETEAQLHFEYNDEEYTLKLIKHRKEKK